MSALVSRSQVLMFLAMCDVDPSLGQDIMNLPTVKVPTREAVADVIEREFNEQYGYGLHGMQSEIADAILALLTPEGAGEKCPRCGGSDLEVCRINGHYDPRLIKPATEGTGPCAVCGGSGTTCDQGDPHEPTCFHNYPCPNGCQPYSTGSRT